MASSRARQLRKTPTFAERRLWGALRDLRRQGFHFRRQVPIDQFIVDFACVSQRLVIEVDGYHHLEPEGLQSDAARDAHLAWRGFRDLRFGNGDVADNLDGVLSTILAEIGLAERPG